MKLLLGPPESQLMSSMYKRLPEQMCLEEAMKCGQWFCWCHVFRGTPAQVRWRLYMSRWRPRTRFSL